MAGTMSDVTMSEAIAKLPHCGSARAAAAGYCVNATGLYDASRQNAFSRPVDYINFGYMPYEDGGTHVSDTLLNWHADFAVAQAALALGHADDAAVLMARANNFSALLDPARGFFTPRSKTGAFTSDFDQFAWGPGPGYTEVRASRAVLDRRMPFLPPTQPHPPPIHTHRFSRIAPPTQAGPWQYRVEVPYAPQALKSALAGMGFDACDIVQQANTIPSTYHAGGYGGVIHEQARKNGIYDGGRAVLTPLSPLATPSSPPPPRPPPLLQAEMAANCWAQWELNNQPVWALQHMQIAFDSSVSGKCASQAQYWLRKSASLFKAGPAMFPGDEDNGSMGAWFILNALGLYPLSPASGDYVLGSPLFGNVSIAIDGAAQPLTILALNQAPENVYVHAVSWRGVPITGVTVPYASLMQGGVLQFTMASSPAGEESPAARLKP